MSIENDDKRYIKLPGIPPRDHPPAAALDGKQHLVSVPPLDPGEPRSANLGEPLNEKAGAVVGKEHPGLAAEAAPKGHVSTAAEASQDAGAAPSATKVRRTRATKTKDQAHDAADGAQPVDATAKPARKARGAVEIGAIDHAPRAESAKPPQARSRTTAKAATIPEQSAPVAGLSSAANGSVAPPITAEAITFLSNPNAKANELFRLQPDSQNFVQYHYKNMYRLDAAIERGHGYLAAMAPKFSPAFEKAADTLIAKLSKDRRDVAVQAESATLKPASPQLPGGSYGPKAAEMGAYKAVPVQLRKMEIQPNISKPHQEVGTGKDSADIKRANSVIGTAEAMMSAQIGEVTPEQATALVAGDVGAVRFIRDEKARQLALSAMAESSQAQPEYKSEFRRIAADLVAPANEANAALIAQRSALAERTQPVHSASEKDVMNTIERGIKPQRKIQPDKQARMEPSADRSTQSAQASRAPAIEPAAPDVAQSAPAPGFGKRLFRAMSVAWQIAREEGRRPQAPDANPASPEKQRAPTTSAKEKAGPTPTTRADDKTNLVPESVKRRFLKVEQEYYFPDRTPAFSDRGNKLATRGAHPEVVRSLIEIAKARDWDSITVKGTGEFRRDAWMEATQAGLKVAGYKPTAQDLAELANKPMGNTVEKGITKDRDSVPKQPAHAQPVKVESRPQVSQAALAKGANPELAAKARAFEKEKPVFAVKKHPDLAQAYGVVDAAKKFADANLAADSRDEFVSIARRHVMQKIIAGEQVKGPHVYMAPVKTKDGAEQTKTSTSQAIDQGKPARSNEAAQER